MPATSFPIYCLLCSYCCYCWYLVPKAPGVSFLLETLLAPLLLLRLKIPLHRRWRRLQLLWLWFLGLFFGGWAGFYDRVTTIDVLEIYLKEDFHQNLALVEGVGLVGW
jgi:hypothetical protein